MESNANRMQHSGKGFIKPGKTTLSGVSSYSHTALRAGKKPSPILSATSLSKPVNVLAKPALKPSSKIAIQDKAEKKANIRQSPKAQLHKTPTTTKWTLTKEVQFAKLQAHAMSKSPKPQSKTNLLAKADMRFDNTLKSFGIFSKTGCTADKASKINQDAAFYKKNFFQIRNVHLFGVLDGHGDSGHILAEDIKKLIQQNLIGLEEENKKNKGCSLFLQGKEARKNLAVKAFEKTQEEVLSGNIADANKSGSTASLLFLFGKSLLCANVGDSRMILASQTKDQTWTSAVLSKDHKPDSEAESARIKAAGGCVDQYRGRI
eukprot:TRINITY_DN4116_c0_g3_i1.p1 TRINITY_DN4116_c0_g3~~TRINITY_DN4116_c0_g3_i1.p1  ORF type:complete len:319 (-),score=48.53 TRINITY_DN4116_c0_g3_i1:446-1402(-)